MKHHAWAALLLVCSLACTDLFKKQQACSRTPSREPPVKSPGGVFFAANYLDDSFLGWLLRLDAVAREGEIYSPFSNLKLDQFTVKKEDEISFSIDRPTFSYRFTGRLSLPRLTGEMTATRFKHLPESRWKLRSTDLTFVQLDREAVAGRMAESPSGVYGDLHRSEFEQEHGGVVLVLIQDGDEVQGIFTRFEGTADGTYAIRNVSSRQGQLAFSLTKNGDEEHYSGRLIGERFILEAVSLSSNVSLETRILVKRGHVADLFDRDFWSWVK